MTSDTTDPAAHLEPFLAKLARSPAALADVDIGRKVIDGAPVFTISARGVRGATARLALALFADSQSGKGGYYAGLHGEENRPTWVGPIDSPSAERAYALVEAEFETRLIGRRSGSGPGGTAPDAA